MESLIELTNEVAQGLFEFWYGKLIIGLIACAGIFVVIGLYFLIKYIVNKIKEKKEKENEKL